MLPKFSMAFSRRTITPRSARRCAPRERVMLRMAGSSSGARPTAKAIANSRLGRKGQGDHDLRQQVAEVLDALFEARLRQAERQLTGDLAEGRARAGLGHQRPRRAGTNRGSQEHRVRPFCQTGGGWDGARGRVLLQEAEHRAAEDDDPNDPGVHPFPDEKGSGGGCDQDQQQADGGGLRFGCQRVGAELLEEAGGLRGGEALFRTPSLDLRGGKIKP